MAISEMVKDRAPKVVRDYTIEQCVTMLSRIDMFDGRPIPDLTTDQSEIVYHFAKLMRERIANERKA